jgi:hypothetical protein
MGGSNRARYRCLYGDRIGSKDSIVHAPHLMYGRRTVRMRTLITLELWALIELLQIITSKQRTVA